MSVVAIILCGTTTSTPDNVRIVIRAVILAIYNIFIINIYYHYLLLQYFFH